MSLSRFDVVSVTCPGNKVTPGTTFTVGEFANVIGGFIQQVMKISPQGWSKDGVECCVLQPGSEKWVKGKVKISLEFIPDEIEEKRLPPVQADQ
jgi:KGK domain